MANLGFVGIGVVQMIVTFTTCGLGSVWGFIEGILCLAGTMCDVDGRPLRERNAGEWKTPAESRQSSGRFAMHLQCAITAVLVMHLRIVRAFPCGFCDNMG